MLKQPYVENYRSNKKNEIIAILFFLALLFTLRLESILNLSSHYLGGRSHDAGLYIWLFDSNLRDLFSLPWFNTSGFYPYTKSLAWSDNFILPSLIALPFIKLGLSKVIAYNCTLLLAVFLNAYVTYRLAYLLTGNFIGSLLSGMSFLLFPFLTLHLGHPQLQFAFWIPLTLIFLFKFYNEPLYRYAILTGFCVFLSYLTTVYYTIFILITLKVLFLSLLIQKYKFYTAKTYLKLLAGFIIGFIPVIFFVLPYLDVKNTFGTRYIYESQAFSANFLSYLTAPSINNLYSSFSKFSHLEAQFFSGFLIIFFMVAAYFRSFGNKKFRNLSALFILSLIATSALSSQKLLNYNISTAICLWICLATFVAMLFRLGKLESKLKSKFITNRGLIASFLLVSLFFYFLSFGPLGSGYDNNYALYSLYYNYFPGASALRAISRAGIVNIFFLSLLIPFTFNFLSKLGFLPKAIIPLLFIITYVENYCGNYPLEEKLEKSAVIKHLENKASKNGVVIALPFTSSLKENNTVKSWSNFANYNVNYLNNYFDTNMKIVNGYSGQRSRIMTAIPGKLKNFPDESSINALSEISNLRYVVYNSNYDLNYDATTFYKNIAKHSNSLTHVMSDKEGRHLFEYHHVTKINKNYTLQVPSYPKSGLVSLQLSVRNTDLNSIPVAIYIKKHFDKLPYTIINIDNEKLWKTYKVVMPNTPDSVRPTFISFGIPDNVDVYLKDRLYSNK